MTNIVIGYLVLTVATGIIGFLFMAEHYRGEDEYVMGARMLLTCWAWPVWIGVGLVYLAREAKWEPHKPSLHKPSWLHWPHLRKRPTTDG